MDQLRKSYIMSLVIKIKKFLILLIFAQSVSTLEVSNLIEPPKISLEGYQETDSFQIKDPDKNFSSKSQFESNYVSRNGTDYVIFEGVQAAIFSCEANYSINWTYPFPEQLHFILCESLQSSDFRYSDFNKDTPEPINKRFRSSILIHTVFIDFLSVNLTCGAVDDKLQVLKSSIFVYVRAKHRIENEGKTLNISMEPSMNQALDNLAPLVLPCRPAFTDAKIALEKEVVTEVAGNNKTVEKIWNAVNFPEKDSSFDPKVGFTLRRGFLGNQLFGLYRCSVISSNDDDGNRQYVIFNVTKPINDTSGSKPVGIFKPTKSVKHKANIHFTQSLHGPQITCCSGVKDKPPKLIAAECHNPLTCYIVRSAILLWIDKDEVHESDPLLNLYGPALPSDCKSSPILGQTQVVVCRGEDVEFAEEYTDIFHPLAAGPVTNRLARITGRTKPKALWGLVGIASLTKFLPSAKVDMAPIDQKMLMLVGRPTPEKPKGLLSPYILFDSQIGDLLENSEDEIDLKQLDGKLRILEKIIKASDVIIEYGRDEFYEGEPLILMCFGIQKYYTEEPHMRLNFKNGSKLVLDERPENEAAKIRWKKPRRVLYLREGGDMFQGDGKAAVSNFGITVNASQEMTSVDCWMPRLESDKWDKISKDIKVVSTVAPRFVEAENEDVYFYLEDVGNSINCTVKDAVPVAFVKGYRDGQRLNFEVDLDKLRRQATSWQELELLKKVQFLNGTRETETADMGTNVISYRIDFDKIEIGHQGVYQCVAKNVNRTVTRTVHVFVTNKPVPGSGMTLPITLAITGLLCVVIIGMVVKHCRTKRTRRLCRTRANNKF